MVFLCKCSFMNLRSSSSSGCDSRISLAGRALGAPGFNSMAWSQSRAGGNSWEAVSLKTLAYFRYGAGIFDESSVSSLKTTRPINRVSVGMVLGRLTVRGRNWAFAASSLRSMSGSWEWSIHPRFQSMRGCTAANQGYPRIALFSPRFVKKKRSRVCCGPVRTCRSVKYWSSPLLFGVPSTLNSFLVVGRRLIGKWRYLAYSRLMKFSVAPESIRVTASALLDLEWMKNRIVIDFRSDMYTFES